MERNRSPVFLSCPARVVAVLVAVAVWILPALAGAQQQYQEGSVSQSWTLPEEAWNVDTWLWPSLLSPSVDFTQHFWFNGAGNAYTSLQQDPDGMRQASFSIWDATGAERSVIPGADCYAFDGGRTCTIPYDFSTGRWYRLRIWRLNITSYGTWWWGSVIDDAGNESHIGSILAPLGDDLITGTLSFSKYFGTSVGYPCGLLPPSTVYFYQPILNNGGSQATISSSDTQQCSAGRVTPLWNNTLSQLELGVTLAAHEITLENVRFNYVEDSVYGVRVWVWVTARNTGTRVFDREDGVWADLFPRFYAHDGESIGSTSQAVGFVGRDAWPPGEVRTGTGFQYVRDVERVSYYLIQNFGDKFACVGCDRRFTDVLPVYN